jgi:NAD(P)H dehydrogenase (quinone)
MHAITGITGQVGGALARMLLQSGVRVRAVARDEVKTRPWVERGCEFIQAEMTDAASLTRAFNGADGVFVLIPPIFDPSPDLREVCAVIEAVRSALDEARPSRVVVLSTVGAQATQPNLLGQLGLVERELGELAMPIAYLRAAWFMENAAWDIAGARDGVIHSFLQPVDRAIPMVATSDVGAEAARLLGETWKGRRVVELQGPSPVSPNDVAATFASLVDHPVRVETVPRADWERLFRSQGMSNPTPRMEMLDGFNQGWIDFERSAGTEAATGSTTLATVLRGLLKHR